MLRSSDCLSIIWLLARFVLGGLHLTHSSFLPTALLKVSYHNLFALKSNFFFNVFYLRMNLCDRALSHPPHQEVSATEAQGWLSADFLATATIDQLNKVCLEIINGRCCLERSLTRICHHQYHSSGHQYHPGGDHHFPTDIIFVGTGGTGGRVKFLLTA